MEESLFPLPEKEPTEGKLIGQGTPRLSRPDRAQIEWRAVDLDSLLAEDHEARLIWAWVMGMDLSPLYRTIRAVEGEAGRRAIDPAILLALWLYATMKGVGSARELERLCEEHIAYQWLCGGVSVNYHTLADFRVEQEAFLERQLVQSIAALTAAGLVKLEQVAQDGKKIRASAGSSSFHRRQTLDKHVEQAEEQVARLREEIDANTSASTKRQQAARERASRERLKRLEAAKCQLERMEKRAEQTGRAKADRKQGKERRASETDPEARVMKMANGGFNPAYNAQFCTDTQSNLIVGVQLSQQGNDTGLASPMLTEVQTNYGLMPAEAVLDSSYFSQDEIVTLCELGCTPYVAIPDKGTTPESRYQPKKNDPPQVADCRLRMGTPAGQEMLTIRGAVAELVHAVLDQCNLARVQVRGLKKVRTLLLWFTLVHNWMRERLLRQKLAQASAV
jgi:transposase